MRRDKPFDVRVGARVDSRTAVLAAVAIVAGLIGVCVPDGPVGVAAGVVILCLLGPAALVAIFRRHRLDAFEAAVVAAGLCLVALVIIGLALNALSQVDRRGWLTALTIVTVVALMSTAGRRSDDDPARQARPERAEGSRPPSRRPSLSQVSIALAVIIGAGAIGVSVVSANGQSSPAFTQLWLLPAAAGNRNSDVTLGVSNDEHADESYRLTLGTAGRTIRSWQVDLASGRSWQVTIDPDTAGPLTAELFRQGDDTAYRQVTLRSGSREAPPSPGETP